MNGSVNKKHGRKAIKEYFIKTICYLLIMLAVTIAVAFATINTVTNFVHRVEERVPMEVRDIVLDDGTYNLQKDEYSEAVEYDYGAKIGVITGESFGLNSSIYCGSNRVSLSNGVGFEKQSGLIGDSGTSVIIGYMEGKFSPLEYAKKGDVIHITTAYGNYSYSITDIQYVKSSDESFKSSGNSLVLCGICSDFSQHSGENLVVFADMIDREVQ